jgi:hypothetical protein
VEGLKFLAVLLVALLGLLVCSTGRVWVP